MDQAKGNVGGSLTHDSGGLQENAGSVEELGIGFPIDFQWGGSSELVAVTVRRIRELATELKNRLPYADFSSLDSITVYSDFLKAVELAAAIASEHKKPSPAELNCIYSVAMLGHGRVGRIMAIHESVVLALASEEERERAWGTQVLKHELCHAIDDAFRASLTEQHDIPTDEAATLLRPSARGMWQEFFANKYSLDHTTNPRIFLDLVKASIPAVAAEVLEARQQFELHNSKEHLVASVLPRLHALTQNFGYAIGALSASQLSIADLAPDVQTVIHTFGFASAWKAAVADLEAMDMRRPAWSSAHETDALLLTCTEMLGALGVFLNVSDGKVNIRAKKPPQ